MSFDRDPDARLTYFTACVTVSNNAEDDAAFSMPRNVVFDQLLSYLASAITEDCMVRRKEKYHTAFELRAYVLTADQLERLVQQRAERMVRGWPGIESLP